MKTIRVGNSRQQLQEVAQKAAAFLAGGGVVIFPSDTCYGLAADPTNKGAMHTLFAIKQRSREKAVSCIFRDFNEVKRWANVSECQKDILGKNLPGPFTFLLGATNGYPLEDKKVGVRIPDTPLTQALSKTVGKPYTATSANVSGEQPAYSITEIYAQFENANEQPDLVIDAGALPHVPPSTIVDLSGKEPFIVRSGSLLPVF